MILDDLLGVRPYLYHLTSRENLPSIVRRKKLLSANRILERAGRLDLLRTRRLRHEEVRIDDTRHLLRDQLPLQAGNIAFDEGVTFDAFVELLNTLVFFWPGGETGPIRMGVNHFGRYAAERPAVLRVEFSTLLDANPGLVPRLARVNSGAPRCHPTAGKGRRGHSTFTPPAHFQGTAGDVREVVFEGQVVLPAQVEVGTIRGNLWMPAQ